MKKKLVTVDRYEADIYQNESFWIDVERDDGAEFEDTNTFEIEIRNNLNAIIKTEQMQRSVDKKTFEVRFFDTSSWVVGNKYKMLGRLKDTNSLMNDVVLEVAFTVI